MATQSIQMLEFSLCIPILTFLYDEYPNTNICEMSASAYIRVGLHQMSESQYFLDIRVFKCSNLVYVFPSWTLSMPSMPTLKCQHQCMLLLVYVGVGLHQMSALYFLKVCCNSEYSNAWIYSPPDIFCLPSILTPTFVNICELSVLAYFKVGLTKCWDHHTFLTVGILQFRVFKCSNLLYVFPSQLFFVCWVSKHWHLWNDGVGICQSQPHQLLGSLYFLDGRYIASQSI